MLSLPLLPHGLVLTGDFESTYWIRAERDLNMLSLLSSSEQSDVTQTVAV